MRITVKKSLLLYCQWFHPLLILPFRAFRRDSKPVDVFLFFFFNHSFKLFCIGRKAGIFFLPNSKKEKLKYPNKNRTSKAFSQQALSNNRRLAAKLQGLRPGYAISADLSQSTGLRKMLLVWQKQYEDETTRIVLEISRPSEGENSSSWFNVVWITSWWGSFLFSASLAKLWSLASVKLLLGGVLSFVWLW